MNGYGIITAIAERSDASWQPGPGSIYPALRSLEEEGLIAPEESDGDARRKVFGLTDDGRAYAEAHGDELTKAFQAATEPQRGFSELRHEVHQLHGAIQQVGMTGRPEALAAAQNVLADARRSLYRILADEPTGAARTEDSIQDSTE
jgi:DNA-binding PadR family transcriptional regulator